jgi:hypothetical protein
LMVDESCLVVKYGDLWQRVETVNIPSRVDQP